MRISLWYHTMLCGGKCPADHRFSPSPIDPDWAVPLMMVQMQALKDSGLADAADELVVCVNGGTFSQVSARTCAPAKARFIDHGPNAQSLLPTIHALRQWLPTHPDWLVCFFHSKGVTHPHQMIDHVWRKCMERGIITNWRRCVADLQDGYDSVGTHWLTPERFGALCPIPIWGGMFFWAKASFLAELPALPAEPKTAEDWWLPERWIGMGRRPKVRDYAPHWPNIPECSNALK